MSSEASFSAHSMPPFAYSPADDVLALDHQQRWFTGWGDGIMPDGVEALKTPALGLVWTSQIACRVALVKAPVYRIVNGQQELERWRRWIRVVFAPWID